MSKEKPAHYINGKEFFEEMKIYHAAYLKSVELGEDKPQVSEGIARAIIQINNRLSNLHNFNGYSYKSELIGDGILKCFDKVHRFNPEVSENAFAFFTQISWQAMVYRIKTEQHQTSVKAKLIREKMSDEFVQHGVDADTEEGGNGFVDFLREHDCYNDYHAERIEKAKNEVSPVQKHRNKTPYKTKEVIVKDITPEFDLSAFEAA